MKQYGLRWSNFKRIGNEKIAVYENGSPLSYNTTLDLFDENKVIKCKKCSIIYDGENS